MQKCFSFFTLIIVLFQWNCNQNLSENKNTKTTDSIEIKKNTLNSSDTAKLVKTLKSYLKSGKNQVYKLYKLVNYNNIGLKTSEFFYKPNGEIWEKTIYEYGKNGKLEAESSWDYYLKNERYIKKRIIYDDKKRILNELFYSDSISVIETRKYSYNTFDSIVKITSLRNNNKIDRIEKFFYNNIHQKYSEISVDKNILISNHTKLEYDNSGNLILIKDSASNSIVNLSKYFYDKINHLVEIINLNMDSTKVAWDTISHINYEYSGNNICEEHWVLKDRISLKTSKFIGKYLISEIEIEKDRRTGQTINNSQTKNFYEFYNN